MKVHRYLCLGSLLLVTAPLGCASSSSDDIARVEGDPSRAVTQGGPQDIAEFRSVVQSQAVPAPELLDELGFFAEHAVDLPPADCGHAVCVHAMLGVAPRFDGGNWSMAFIGMNTAVDPARLPKAPRHLIIVAENTPSTAEVMQTFFPLARILSDALGPEDRVSVVFSNEEVVLGAVGATPGDVLGLAFPPPSATNGSFAQRPADAYAALAAAANLATSAEFDGYAQRVLWFTSGQRAGIYSLDRFVALAEAMAQRGVAISAFGMGRGFEREVPSAMADAGSGNYYYAQSPSDLYDALTVEAETAFVPLARSFELSIEARPGYRIGRIYGARRAVATQTTAILTTPTLFIGARRGASDVESGRRGGGGGFFVELLADATPDERPRVAADVFTLSASYVDPESEELVEQSRTLSTPLGVGQNPPMDQPFFSDPVRGKPFMMLNLFLALRAQVTLYDAGECAAALGIENMMSQSYSYWQAIYDDPDIDADYSLLMNVSDVMVSRCARVSPQPPFDFGGGCFMF